MGWPPSAAIGDFFAALFIGIIIAPKVVRLWSVCSGEHRHYGLYSLDK
jgi:hypothetical protein